MKTLLITLFCLVPLIIQAQNSFVVSKLDLEDVPAAVSASFASQFKETKVVRWELHAIKGEMRNLDKYVAIFDQDGIRSRARYLQNGDGITVSSYYLFKRLERLPDAVRAFAKTNYPDYQLGSGEKIESLKISRYVYRIRLRKGASD